MPSVQQPKRSPEFVNGKQNVVIGVTPAQLLAVSWVDGSGQKSMALVLQFGKDTEDGGPGVFVMADENEMVNQLKLPNATIKKGVRQWLAKQADPTAEEVPETATALVAPSAPKAARKAVPAQVDVGQMEGPVTDGDADISKIDLG